MSRAIFLGTFNPPHKGHRDVIEAVINSDVMTRCGIEKIHIIPTHQNPNKPKSIPFFNRYKMCQGMFGDIPNVLIDDIENVVKPEYTFDLLKRFNRNEDEMIKNGFWWIITYETLEELIDQEWYKSATILCENNFIVVVQNDSQIKIVKDYVNIKSHIVKLQNFHPLHSTQIREKVKNGEDVTAYTNEAVNDHIVRNHLYQI